MTDFDYPQDQVDDEAAEWIVRMGAGPLSGRQRGSLANWLNRSPAHPAALGTARTTWDRTAHLALTATDLGLKPLPSATPRRLAPRAAAAAAALAAAVLLAVWTGLGAFIGNPLTLIAADHRTGRGQLERVVLADGSEVQIGAASAIAVHFSDGERAVEVLAGLAYFTVTPTGDGERRPFVVIAANGRSRALGTQFMVERRRDGVEVTVTEHDVEVSAASALHGDQSVRLHRGHSVRYQRDGLGRPVEADLSTATAWRRGMLVFDRVPLSHVVEELNRYRSGRIIVSNPMLASREVSGVFSTANPEAVLDTVIQVLDARSATLPLLTVLY